MRALHSPAGSAPQAHPAEAQVAQPPAAAAPTTKSTPRVINVDKNAAYPKVEHLQHVLELCVQQHVFAPEREEEEIRALWKTAYQRVLLDESWLSALLARPSAAPTPVEEVVLQKLAEEHTGQEVPRPCWA